jgi:hypothetical protein
MLVYITDVIEEHVVVVGGETNREESKVQYPVAVKVHVIKTTKWKHQHSTTRREDDRLKSDIIRHVSI